MKIWRNLILLLVCCRTNFVGAFTELNPKPSSKLTSSLSPYHKTTSKPFSSLRMGYGFDDWQQENQSPLRKERLAREKAIRTRFLSGRELSEIRADIKHLRISLQWAKAAKDKVRVRELSKAIAEGEDVDAECVYAKALTTLNVLRANNDFKFNGTLQLWEKKAEEARSCIPRFQLDGLWLGDFGDDGYQMINVTYSGDSIIGTMVTDCNSFRRGMVIFESNLSPISNSTGSLPPIQLPKEVADKWGVDNLFRYAGNGFVTQDRRVKSKDMEGQFIMFENHFSFVWIPTRKHVLFSRPSQEVILGMLRDIISKEDEIENMRHHLEKCAELDVTTSHARALSSEKEPFRRIRRNDELTMPNFNDVKQQTSGTSDASTFVQNNSNSTLQLHQKTAFLNLLKKNNWKGYFNLFRGDNEKKEGDLPF